MEAAWKLVLLFWRRLEQSLTLLGGGLKSRVDRRTILMRLGGGLEASCGRLERVLEPSWRSWRRSGASSEIFCGLGHGIAFTVDFEKDFRQYESRLVLGFQEETRQAYIVLRSSVYVTWKRGRRHGTL